MDNNIENNENELKEAKMELLHKEEIIGEVLINLEKANLILDHWREEYLFNEDPDPEAALKWGTDKKYRDDAKITQSFKWYWEYKYISKFIEIVSDYVFLSEDKLKELLEE